MSILILAAALISLAAGLAIFGVKPQRFTNRIFLVTSILAALWLVCMWAAIRAGQSSSASIAAPVIWIRLNSIASILWVWAILVLTYSVTTHQRDESVALRRFSIWLLLTASVCSLTFSDHYVRPSETYEKGPLYYVIAVGAYAVLGWLTWRICKQIRQYTGIRRVELQFLSLPLAAGSIGVLLFTTIGNVAGLQLLRRLSFVPFIVSYCISAWAITFHRLYNPRDIMLSLGQLALVLTVAIAGAYGLIELLRGPSIMPGDIFIGAGLSFSLAFWIENRTRRWFGLRNDNIITSLRNAVAAITHAEANPQALVARFEEMLRSKSGTGFVTLLSQQDGAFAGKGLLFRMDRPGYIDLFEQTWATPESLERRRSTEQTGDLMHFLSSNSIAALVAAPCGNPAPSLLIAFGEKENGWPFTYPEIERMQNIAELMDNVLTHARLTAEAALKQKFEYLALMSRGLAHDLKNLITPVSSLLVHTEKGVCASSDEAEVHAAAKRSIRLMTEYIREALFFANRFTPRFECAYLPDLLRSAVEVAAQRAERNRVSINIAGKCLRQAYLDRVLIQRVITNLLNNAIDASPAGSIVTLSASATAPQQVRIQVSDSGSGIAPEHRTRIFEPYFTTKQFGDEVRGFGLGLTICEKIVQLHGGSILVESDLGRGTVVTVDLPTNPSHVIGKSMPHWHPQEML